MIQDIAPHQYKNEYRPVPPEKDSYALYYENHVALVKRVGEEIEFPTFGDLEKIDESIYNEYIYLFSIDDRRFYLVEDIDREPLSEFNLENTEIFRRAQPQYLSFAGITGYQLYNWYENHHYCGKCGKTMKKDEKERMLFCEKCHTMEYPKLSPATIIGVHHGNRLLLSKYAGRAYTNYALLAGFVEIGEPVEDTVKREVMEEVGLKVKNITYYKSQPWSFTDTVLMGFYAELDGEEEITLDREELAMAEWFEREDIPDMPGNGSLTSEMIMRFKNNEHPIEP